jgi:hypothetical protein
MTSREERSRWQVSPDNGQICRTLAAAPSNGALRDPSRPRGSENRDVPGGGLCDGEAQLPGGSRTSSVCEPFRRQGHLEGCIEMVSGGRRLVPVRRSRDDLYRPGIAVTDRLGGVVQWPDARRAPYGQLFRHPLRGIAQEFGDVSDDRESTERVLSPWVSGPEVLLLVASRRGSV